MINVYEKRVIEHTVNYITIILKKKKVIQNMQHFRHKAANFGD